MPDVKHEAAEPNPPKPVKNPYLVKANHLFELADLIKTKVPNASAETAFGLALAVADLDKKE